MAAPELAAIWRVPVTTVRRWASEDRKAGHPWPQTRSRPVRYQPDVAQDAYERRRDARAETIANLGVSNRPTGL